jgi:NAD(P)-dependent dehydrogenase (short-subunit alcohol dehydrogenase family)
MMANVQAPEVILCTGANQGLGFSIIEVTGRRYPSATYILCSRNLASGEEAVNKLKELGVKAEIKVLQLDVTNDEQIEAAVQHVKSKYGKLDGGLPLLLPTFRLYTYESSAHKQRRNRKDRTPAI